MNQQEKEWLLLSGMIKNYENYVVGSALINPAHLSTTSATIYESVKSLYDGGSKNLERESIIYDLDSKGKLTTIGGMITIDSLAAVEFTLDSEGFSRLCTDIADNGEAARVRSVLKELSEDELDAKSLIAKAIDQIYRITNVAKDRFGIIKADEIINVASVRRPFAKTCITPLDSIIGGLHFGDYMLIAARPSMGKSALGMQISYETAVDGNGTLFLSLEMTQEMIKHRLNNYVGGIPELLSDLPLYFKCESNMTFPDIAATIQMSKLMHDIKVVVIDYIGLIKGQRNDQSTNLFITYISNGLQNLARSMNICIIALAQLNRNSEIQERPPAIYDLRDSGTLEQDADSIILIYRPTRGQSARAKLLVVKYRHGEIGEVNVNFDHQTLKFEEV